MSKFFLFVIYFFQILEKKYVIRAPNRKTKKTYFIKNIDKFIIITIYQTNNKEFILKNGYFVFFKEVKGINELNEEKPKKIINVYGNSFSIEDDN